MSSNEQLVLGAVRQKEASKKQSALQKLFAVWFDAFVYNQIWEDPRVDVEALKLDKDSRILTISSGGCNALNYLIENPESVTAVDLNRHHIYLLNLKIAALKALPAHKDFFAFFGYGKGKQNLDNYKTFVATELDKKTTDFKDVFAVFYIHLGDEFVPTKEVIFAGKIVEVPLMAIHSVHFFKRVCHKLTKHVQMKSAIN